MEVKSRQYKTNGKTLWFRPNFRASIEYERVCGEALGESTGIEKNLLYLFTGTIAGMKKAGLEFTMSFEEFIDFIDDDFDVLNRMMEEERKDKAEDTKK